MAKRKLNAAMILAAGDDAHLQTNERVSHAKSIDGESFVELNVDEILNNPMQPRLQIDEKELEELARSIKLHGLIQPIAVIKAGEQYILKAGQRRLLAHKKLGLKTIKAIVQAETLLPKKESEKVLFEIAVMENTQRDNLNPLELALSLRQAMDKKLYSNMEELATALGKSKSYISKVLKVLALDDIVINDLSKNRSTNDIESLYEIQKIKDSEEQVKTYFAFIEKKIDRQKIREKNKIKSDQTEKKGKTIFLQKDNRIKLDLDTTKMSKENKENLINDINKILDKYFYDVK